MPCKNLQETLPFRTGKIAHHPLMKIISSAIIVVCAAKRGAEERVTKICKIIPKLSQRRPEGVGI
jgi:hypothetical protein